MAREAVQGHNAPMDEGVFYWRMEKPAPKPVPFTREHYTVDTSATIQTTHKESLLKEYYRLDPKLGIVLNRKIKEYQNSLYRKNNQEVTRSYNPLLRKIKLAGIIIITALGLFGFIYANNNLNLLHAAQQTIESAHHHFSTQSWQVHLIASLMALVLLGIAALLLVAYLKHLQNKRDQKLHQEQPTHIVSDSLEIELDDIPDETLYKAFREVIKETKIEGYEHCDKLTNDTLRLFFVYGNFNALFAEAYTSFYIATTEYQHITPKPQPFDLKHCIAHNIPFKETDPASYTVTLKEDGTLCVSILTPIRWLVERKFTQPGDSPLEATEQFILIADPDNPCAVCSPAYYSNAFEFNATREEAVQLTDCWHTLPETYASTTKELLEKLCTTHGLTCTLSELQQYLCDNNTDHTYDWANTPMEQRHYFIGKVKLPTRGAERRPSIGSDSSGERAKLTTGLSFSDLNLGLKPLPVCVPPAPDTFDGQPNRAGGSSLTHVHLRTRRKTSPATQTPNSQRVAAVLQKFGITPPKRAKHSALGAGAGAGAGSGAGAADTKDKSTCLQPLTARLCQSA